MFLRIKEEDVELRGYRKQDVGLRRCDDGQREVDGFYFGYEKRERGVREKEYM